MSMGGADCAESADPRHAGHCYRCNCEIPRGPEPIFRNLELEREIVREATRGAVDPSRLIDHCQIRADRLSGEYVSHGSLIKPGVDRPKEAREEAPDGINHLLFHIQEHPDDPANEDYLIAIRFFGLAYERIRKGRQP